MKYERIIRAVAGEVWAIDPDKGRAMVQLLALAASGGTKNRVVERAETIPGQTARALRNRPGAVAVVPIMGIMALRKASLMEDISSPPAASTEEIGRMIDQASADPEVKMILLHIDSPGGTVTGTPELAAKIRAARDVKPVVAQVNATAASAAYWAAAQATEVVVTPSGMVGSVGVYILHEDMSEALKMEGVTPTFISAGKFKVEGNPFAPLGDEAKEHLQDRVNTVYKQFIKELGAGRNMAAGDIETNFGRGRLVDAERALANGMVDRIATLEETISRYVGDSQVTDSRRSRASARVAVAKAKT